MQSVWETVTAIPNLDTEMVQVVSAPLDRADSEAFTAILSKDERARAARFRFPQDGSRFTVGRATLRILLGQHLDCAPQSLSFSYGAHGKPRLSNSELQRQAPHFNVSHSAGLALYAFSYTAPVGVDLERMCAIEDQDRIAARFFSRAESTALQEIAGPERLRAFYKCWTAKEAFIKAVGDGMTFPLHRFEVEVRLDAPGRLISIDGDPKPASDWTIVALRPAPDYLGAVAIHVRELTMRCVAWQPVFAGP
jgi:4'-phosphopantetheinyl transferase